MTEGTVAGRVLLLVDSGEGMVGEPEIGDIEGDDRNDGKPEDE
jgi:hypothetical protein